MKKVYLDNAATTQIRSEVIEEMVRCMTEDYGNPSSTHSFGRSSKNILELSRKAVAKHLNATSQEIIFTSGATEANNLILQNAVGHLGLKRIITSKIEHHAVLHAVEMLHQKHHVAVDFVRIKPDGTVDINHLVELLSDNSPTIVSLMHVNNETGTMLDLAEVATICKQYKAYFHSDTVQSIGKTTFDLQQIPVDFLVASAHKFHGPKGVGFAYIRKGIALQPMFFGGEQEKGLRPGTESIHNIVGMAKALDISYSNLEVEKTHILELKNYTISQLELNFPEIKFNGDKTNTFYNILNVLLPFSESKSAMILFNLDMKGIAVSRGSACQSGSVKPSHVLAEFLSEEDIKKPCLRISFSHYNTREDIDMLIAVLKGL